MACAHAEQALDAACWPQLLRAGGGRGAGARAAVQASVGSLLEAGGGLGLALGGLVNLRSRREQTGEAQVGAQGGRGPPSMLAWTAHAEWSTTTADLQAIGGTHELVDAQLM